MVALALALSWLASARTTETARREVLSASEEKWNFVDWANMQSGRLWEKCGELACCNLISGTQEFEGLKLAYLGGSVLYVKLWLSLGLAIFAC